VDKQIPLLVVELARLDNLTDDLLTDTPSQFRVCALNERETLFILTEAEMLNILSFRKAEVRLKLRGLGVDIPHPPAAHNVSLARWEVSAATALQHHS